MSPEPRSRGRIEESQKEFKNSSTQAPRNGESPLRIDVVAWLDPDSGRSRREQFRDQASREAVRCYGWADHVSGGMAALYLAEADLWFQYAARRWSLTKPPRVELECIPLLHGLFRRFELKVDGRLQIRRIYVSSAVKALWNPADAVTYDGLDEECDDFFLYASSVSETSESIRGVLSLWVGRNMTGGICGKSRRTQLQLTIGASRDCRSRCS